MKFRIDKTVFEKFPNLVVVLPIITGFRNDISHEESVKILRETEEYCFMVQLFHC